MPTAVIIGASSGLGREIALTYIRRGYRIGVAARRIERLDALVGEAPERVVAGTRGIGIAASYSASKRFQSEYLTALSQLAHQRRLPVTITDIKPGFVDTPLLDAHTKYPMMMNTRRATALIVKAIDRRRSRIIDLRWAMVVALWRCVPGFVWRRMRLRLSATDNKN